MLFVVLIMGFLIGSFLNVCIYRIPNGESIINPPSHCYSCNTRLKFIDMIPVVGYFLNRGRCRYCGVKYSIRYSLIELLTGVMYLLIYMKYGLAFESLYMAALCSTILVMIFIDIDHHIIPDRIHVIIIGLGLLYSYNITHMSLLNMGLGFLIGGVLIFIVALIGPMGGGDIKLFASLGIWLGPINVLIAILISFIIGGIVGVLLIVFKLKSRKDHIAFGPFIGIAGVIMIMFSNEIINLYIRMLL